VRTPSLAGRGAIIFEPGPFIHFSLFTSFIHFLYSLKLVDGTKVSIMNKAILLRVLGLSIVLGLSSCSKQESLCKEAMGLRADQLAASDSDKERFVGNCRGSGTVYSVEQWECMITALKKGEAYEQATAQCAPRG
jgi:hypothetical protein